MVLTWGYLEPKGETPTAAQNLQPRIQSKFDSKSLEDKLGSLNLGCSEFREGGGKIYLETSVEKIAPNQERPKYQP